MRIIGIDYGEKRIGIAMSDPLGITAQGLATIQRTYTENDVKEIIKLINENHIEEIVIGLPKHMNNSLGEKAREVLDFIRKLRKHTQLKIKTTDERLSSVMAHRAMKEGNLSRKKRMVHVDMVAAQLILQNYLDSKKTSELK